MAARLLSIGVPTFNRRAKLIETLNSILPQVSGRTDVEVLVCDNASTDDTEEAVGELLPRYPNLRYHRHTENKGFDVNIATCVAKATADYVAFFSDDDLAPAGHVELLCRKLKEKRPTVCYCNHTPFFHDNPSHLASPLSPLFYHEYEDAQDFIVTIGCGFISSLVVNCEMALKTLPFIVPESGTAHQTIAYRVSLSNAGCMIYDGFTTVYSRYDYGGGSILAGGCLNVACLHQSLLADGLLQPQFYQRWLKAQVHSVLPRLVFTCAGKGLDLPPVRDLRRMFGSVPGFYFRVLPLYLIPASLLRLIYRHGKRALHLYRHFIYRNAGRRAGPMPVGSRR